MPSVYFCDMTNFEHHYEDVLHFISDERRKKAERLINKNDALLSAVSGLMLKKLLDIPEEESPEFGEHGKPFLVNGPCFNISHSWKYAVLAVSEGEVGVDIEMRETPGERVMERCFTEEEKEYSKTSTQNFFEIWTAKEAVLKFLGTGFSFSPKNFSVIPFGEKYKINGKDLFLYRGYIDETPFSVAYSEEKENIEVKELFPEDLLY